MPPVSLVPSDFQRGGLFPDGNYILRTPKFVVHNYDGKGQHTLALEVTLEDEQGEKYVQRYSAGDPAFFQPSADGLTVEAIGNRTALSESSNFADFMKHLVNAGFPEDTLRQGAGRISVLDGCFCSMQWQKQQARSNMAQNQAPAPAQANGQPAREPQIFLPTVVLRLPGQEASPAAPRTGIAAAPAGRAVAPRPAATPAIPSPNPAPVPAAAPTAVAEPAAAVIEDTELSEEVAAWLEGQLAASGGTAARGKLLTAAFSAFAADAQKQTAVMAMLSNQAFLRGMQDQGRLAVSGGSFSLPA